MATFDISKKYSATYSYRRTKNGYECPGEIWQRGKRTGIKFVGRGRTVQAAANNALTAAKAVCPTK